MSIEEWIDIHNIDFDLLTSINPSLALCWKPIIWNILAYQKVCVSAEKQGREL